MKKLIYIVLAAVMAFTGCKYNPYYDGQQFRMYNSESGLIETDGCHIYVPIASSNPYVLEFYGGKGKSHTINISDPEYLSYSYEKESVTNKVMDGLEVNPAKVTLIPNMLGDTEITVTDNGTGESLHVYVHIIRAFHMLEVRDTKNSLAKGIILAFEYDAPDDVVKICRRISESSGIEYMFDGRYRFINYQTTVALELEFTADEAGQPSAAGVQTVRTYMVEFKGGGVYGSPYGMMNCLHMKEIPLQTRDVVDEFEFYHEFQFVDITDGKESNPDSPMFYAYSTTLQPWIY